MCQKLRLVDGSVAIVCGGHRTKKIACRWCGDPSTKLCDFVISPPEQVTHKKTCDAPMCNAHAKNVGQDKDFCPAHGGLDVEKTFPTSHAEFIASGYNYGGTSECKACKRRINWYRTPNQRNFPVDAETFKPHFHSSHPKKAFVAKAKRPSQQPEKRGFQYAVRLRIYREMLVANRPSAHQNDQQIFESEAIKWIPQTICRQNPNVTLEEATALFNQWRKAARDNTIIALTKAPGVAHD
jgi:hypothetical protein